MIRLEMWIYLLMKVNACSANMRYKNIAIWWGSNVFIFNWSFIFVKLKICMCLPLILSWISWYKYGDGTKYKVFINYNNEQKNCAEIKSK